MVFWIVFVFKFAQPLTFSGMSLFLYSPSLSLCRASSRGAGSRQVLRPQSVVVVPLPSPHRRHHPPLPLRTSNGLFSLPRPSRPSPPRRPRRRSCRCPPCRPPPDPPPCPLEAIASPSTPPPLLPSFLLLALLLLMLSRSLVVVSPLVVNPRPLLPHRPLAPTLLVDLVLPSVSFSRSSSPSSSLSLRGL